MDLILGSIMGPRMGSIVYQCWPILGPILGPIRGPSMGPFMTLIIGPRYGFH
jgi:hypothetical protein